MSVEWIAVVIAIVTVGVSATVAVVSGFRRLDDRFRGVENELAYLRGLLQGGGRALKPAAADEGPTEPGEASDSPPGSPHGRRWAWMPPRRRRAIRRA